MRDLLEIHSQVSQVAAKAASTGEVLDQVVREGAELIGVERCGIYMREEEEDTFRALASCRGGVTLAEDVRRWRAGVPGDGLTSEAVESGQPVIVEDARADPRMMPVAVERWSIRSIMAVPLVFDRRVVGLMMLDDVDRARSFGEREADAALAFGDFAAATITHTRERLALRSKLDAASRQLTVVRRATRLEEELSEIVRDGGSVREMVACLARLLGKPCAVFRHDGGPIVCGPSADAPHPTLFEPGFIAHPEVRAAIAANEAEGAFLLAPIASAGVRRRHVIAPIRVGEAAWGHLVVAEGQGGISGTDIGAIRRAATLIGLQARAELGAREATRRSTAELFAEILREGEDAGDLRQRAGRLGISLDARRAVVVVSRRGGREEARPLPAAAAIGATMREQTRGLRADAVAIDGSVALLVELPGDGDAADLLAAQRAAFERVLTAHDPEGGELIAGVSNVQRWQRGYRAAYREARQVAECIRRFSPPGGPRLLSAADLGAGGLFLASTDAETVTGFAEETVGKLLDEGANPDLLRTLTSFLANMCGIRATATVLGVHENTVRYRLSRVEEETGLAVLRQPDAQAGAHLALLTLILRGRLPAGAISLCGITLAAPAEAN